MSPLSTILSVVSRVSFFPTAGVTRSGIPRLFLLARFCWKGLLSVTSCASPRRYVSMPAGTPGGWRKGQGLAGKTGESDSMEGRSRRSSMLKGGSPRKSGASFAHYEPQGYHTITMGGPC